MPHPLLDTPPLELLREVSDPQRNRDRMVIEGRFALERALLAKVPLQAVVGTRAHLDLLAIPAEVPVFETERAELQELLGYRFHRGVVGVLQRDRFHTPAPDWSTKRLLLTVLVGLSDPANVGAIIRTAFAFGASAVVVDEASADPYSRRAIRASMGHCFSLPVLMGDAASVLRTLANRRAVRILATTPSATRTLDSIASSACDAVLFGHEGHGLALADWPMAECVRIPIQPQADSLNVAASAAIILHHLSAA